MSGRGRGSPDRRSIGKKTSAASGGAGEVRAAEEPLNSFAESELHWRTLTEAMPQLVWRCTADGRNDYISRQYVDFTGLPAEEQHGLRWMEVLHPADRQRTMDAWRAAL